MVIRYTYTTELQPEGTYLIQFLDFEEGCTERESLEESAKYAKEVSDLLVLPMFMRVRSFRPRPK